MSMRSAAVVLLCLISLPLAGCDHERPASVDDINSSLGSLVILPRFTAAGQTSATLASTVRAWCGEPSSASRADARTAWRQAWSAWQAASVFTFGPLSEEARLRIEFFPDSRDLVEARVNALLAAEAAPGADDIAAATAPVQGFPALEYLLFADREANVDDCAATTAIADSLAARLAQLADAWPGYVHNEFARSGEDGLTLLVESVTREVVAVRDDELGVPLGIASGNVPQPRLAASPYAQASIEAMRAELETLRELVNGAGGPGLATRMRTLGAGTYADDVSALLQQTSAALGRVTLPFAEAVVDPQARIDLYAVFDGEFRALRNQIQSLGGAVGVTPGFNASDGD